jgi:hypothetical protein
MPSAFDASDPGGGAYGLAPLDLNQGRRERGAVSVLAPFEHCRGKSLNQIQRVIENNKGCRK